MGNEHLYKQRQKKSAHKRFWKEVTIAQESGGFSIELDQRPVRLPKGTRLSVPSYALAEALAEEWRAAGCGEGKSFTSADLPLTGMTGFMVECLPSEREAIIQSLLAYAQSDVLCYREASQKALYRRQSEVWDPLLQQLEVVLGCRLMTTTGVMPITQTNETIQIFQKALEASTQAELAVLGNVVPILGSLALGFLILKANMTAETAVDSATLDEQFQMTLWGRETEITHRIESMKKEISIAIRFLALYQKGNSKVKDAHNALDHVIDHVDVFKT